MKKPGRKASPSSARRPGDRTGRAQFLAPRPRIHLPQGASFFAECQIGGGLSPFSTLPIAPENPEYGGCAQPVEVKWATRILAAKLELASAAPRNGAFLAGATALGADRPSAPTGLRLPGPLQSPSADHGARLKRDNQVQPGAGMLEGWNSPLGQINLSGRPAPRMGALQSTWTIAGTSSADQDPCGERYPRGGISGVMTRHRLPRPSSLILSGRAARKGRSFWEVLALAANAGSIPARPSPQFQLFGTAEYLRRGA